MCEAGRAAARDAGAIGPAAVTSPPSGRTQGRAPVTGRARHRPRGQGGRDKRPPDFGPLSGTLYEGAQQSSPSQVPPKACPSACEAAYPRSMDEDYFKPTGVGNYQMVFSPSSADLEFVKSKIFEGGPVSFGIYATQNFMAFIVMSAAVARRAFAKVVRGKLGNQFPNGADPKQLLGEFPWGCWVSSVGRPKFVGGLPGEF